MVGGSSYWVKFECYERFLTQGVPVHNQQYNWPVNEFDLLVDFATVRRPEDAIDIEEDHLCAVRAVLLRGLDRTDFSFIAFRQQGVVQEFNTNLERQQIRMKPSE